MFDNYLDYVGYIASIIILISLFTQSIKRLRMVNLVGAFIFAIYGYLISAYPVLIMNTAVVFVNLYYLYQMIKTKDYFTILSVNHNEYYLKQFIRFHEKSINKAMPFNESMLGSSNGCFFILRNMIPAGLFIVKHHNEDTLEITLDYATPSYQDFKTGNHVFVAMKERFIEKGYHQFITFSDDLRHQRYLEKMGFTRDELKAPYTYIKKI